MGLSQVTPPTEEPITLVEAKDYLKFETNASDSLITAQIVAARQWCETFTRRSFITATWSYTLDRFPAVIRPPRSTLISVDQITYLDDAGAQQTLDPSKYLVDTNTEPGRITPAYNELWPTTYPVINAVTVQFKAGYGTASDVPAPIKEAIRRLVTDFFELRGGVLVGTVINPIPLGIERVLLPYVVDWF